MGHLQAETLYKNTQRQFTLLSVNTEISVYKIQFMSLLIVLKFLLKTNIQVIVSTVDAKTLSDSTGTLITCDSGNITYGSLQPDNEIATSVACNNRNT